METISVRYIVEDAEEAAGFYRDLLGFKVEANPGPGFAMLSKGSLRLLLNAAGAGGAGQQMPDGSSPQPGGWNRIQLRSNDLEAEIKRLNGLGARFRNTLIQGRGGKQILLEDPSGNLIELFEPARQP